MLKNEKECDLDRRELQLLREKNQVQEQRIANLEKENDLLKQELNLKDRINEVKDMEIQATRRALGDMEKVVDRSIKLAEVSKPSTLGNWQLYGLFGLAAVFAGYVFGAR